MDDLAGAAVSETGEAMLPDELGQLLAIKDGDTFLIADAWGDVLGGADGLFSNDTRVLSRFRLLIGERRPSKLSFGLSRDNVDFTFHGANLALPPVGGRTTPRGVIHVERKRCLNGGQLFERLRLTNFGLDEVMLPITFEYGADFRDMFEVRGLRRAARGTLAEPLLTGRGVEFGYRGLDGVERKGAVMFSEPPWRLTSARADFMFAIAPGKRVDLYVEAGGGQTETPTRDRFADAIGGARRSAREIKDRGARLGAADGAFDAWLEQSRADVAALTTALPTGPYPYAGIPWFSTPFGRDGIITAWQMLWLDPSLAKGVLTYLARRQASISSDVGDATPGKIMHETRCGEMAALNEIPFGLYYGGVDTTPLFVALAGAYLERTADLSLIRRLWPALIAATRWLDEHGDSNGDGLIDYSRATDSGLSNQGWKDSVDSIFHDDGRFAAGPIALVEVQGYAFAAWRAMAFMASRLGAPGGEAWMERAEVMRETVETRFWMERRGFYALAIDGNGEVCAPLASNPGHLLFVGLPRPDRAARVTERLLSARFDSGWGIRTLAAGTMRFNPMSYHNGSIWPHDTALVASGMARYGERAGAAKLLSDLFEVAKNFDMRMPELLCGFVRQADEPPIAYPIACIPQAWAAGSAFMMLQACLGLSIDAERREVRLVRPILPAGVDQLTLAGLSVGGAYVAIDFQRLGGRIAAIPGPSSDGSVSVVIEG
ncbi:MAG: amylo-alpha-1,6-glucosidase [Pseudomonadota bacterium]|nr:amylo-alpha-1,6-glucosidase [Pseudomonadota bacterium]